MIWPGKPSISDNNSQKRSIKGKYQNLISKQTKTAPKGTRFPQVLKSVVLTLTGFEPAICFVDHVNAAFATHNTAITVPVLERAERVFDFHNKSSFLMWRGPAPGVAGVPENRNSEFMVGTTRFELVTPSMSTKCSTAELSAHECQLKIQYPNKNGAQNPAPVAGL